VRKANKPMSDINAVKLAQSSEEPVVGQSHRPAASEVPGAPSREALLRACAGGDRTALHSLYARTVPQLFGLALRILRNRELAEDIVQDSFVYVWRNAHSFDPGRGSAMAWLTCIVRNRCIDVIRRRGREAPLGETAVEDWEEAVPHPADRAALSPDACRFQDWLDQLEEGPRQALKLVYYGCMTYDEVAAYVGVPVGTVKGWVRSSLVQLRGCSER
jgi:RNA polymerase sigma-70 factor (ECF subfamily)